MMKLGGFVHKEIAKETEEKAVSDSKPEKSDPAEKEEKARTGVSGQMGLSRSLSMPAHYRSEVTALTRGLEPPGGSTGLLSVLRTCKHFISRFLIRCDQSSENLCTISILNKGMNYNFFDIK